MTSSTAGRGSSPLAALQAAYKTFTDKHGQLLQAKAYTVTTTETDRKPARRGEGQDTRYRHPLESLLRSDPDAYLTLALEKFNDETGQITTTDALNKRVLEAPAHARVETAHDAPIDLAERPGPGGHRGCGEGHRGVRKGRHRQPGHSDLPRPSAGWQMADEYLSAT